MSGKKLRETWSWILVVAGILLLLGVQAYAAEIDQIQQAIRAKQARWVARENPISKLPPEVRKKLLGAPSEEFDTGAPLMEPSGGEAGALPAAYDWRSAPGGNFVTPVRDQQSCGSCWAFATTAALEAKCLITFTWPGRNLDLSEQIVLNCTGPARNSCDSGYASDASNFLKDTGTSLESCSPYTHVQGACSSACPHWQSRAYRFASWQYVSVGSSASVATIKNAIYNNGPVVAWFRVYNDFYSYSSGVYTYTTGAYVGNHYVLVTGWDDTSGAFIVKNSWNTTWGALGGYFKIAYSELTGDTLFGSYTYGYGKAIGPKMPNPLLWLLLD